ncbi:MAG: Bacterial SH3 domain protein [Syntrophorhabdus sp. PtaU1.Bin153]|nr:MAG: Bacterial SH3 domain protein [Syntrophorhabdus sp. PtaU1.Bin153]
MIPLQTFLSNIQKIVASKPYYQLGEDGSRGKCDCIGLIIGAFRRSGEPWPGKHGSNWTARNHMVALTSPVIVELGNLVFKAYEPGDKANTLPDDYKGHPDQRDYYHVGVITSVSPLQITHCTGGTTNGIKVDTKIGQWRFSGRVDGVDYESKEDIPPMNPAETAIVAASSGKSVRMRASPSIQSIAKANVPIGAEVDVLQKAGDWWEIRYGGKTGWMLATFLNGDAVDDDPPVDIPNTVTITIDRALAELFAEALAVSIREKST